MQCTPISPVFGIPGYVRSGRSRVRFNQLRGMANVRLGHSFTTAPAFPGLGMAVRILG